MVLHWPLSELLELDWLELLHWHRLAIERFKIQAKIGGF